MCESEKSKKFDWAKIRAEYVTGNESLKDLSLKYKISHSALCKKSAKGKWSILRKKKQAEKAEKVAEKLQTKEVRDAVKNIDRLVNTAEKLLTKADNAIDELRTLELINTKVTTEQNKSKTTGKVTSTQKTIHSKVLIDGIIDTKRLSEISKSLVNIKQIFDGKPDNDDSDTGIVIMPQIEHPQPPTDEKNTDEVIISDE